MSDTTPAPVAQTTNLPPSAAVATTPPAQPQLQQWWYYAIFTASGFSALIYESLWTRYLKNFLGHAAYAQSLVLIIFLLGLAAGSMLVARHSRRLASPMLIYAIVEVLLALAAVYFHDIFVGAQNFALNDVLPHLGATTGALFKWALAAALILPQTILLGATFPLLAAGIIRRWPQQPGGTIATLYYSNALGGVGGVLIGGFLLIPHIGLPGAGLIGGGVNAGIALLVWLLVNKFGEVAAAATADSPPAATTATTEKILIITAAITGMSSFIYEIVWTRLISLLLGASTYSFEIMLAVFIFGIALGSIIIRRHTDKTTEPIITLGQVQLAMGGLALMSLLIYPLLFEQYLSLWPQLPRTDTVYLYHWLLGGALAAAMILPTAICAGMTLPLITRRLMQQRGEASLGIIYAANTIGSIIGVYLAAHWLLATLSAQYTMVFGALCDLLLGCALLMYVRQRTAATVATAFTAAITAIALIFGGIPLRLAASGIYRLGKTVPESTEIVFYRDGKTASVAVLQDSKEDRRTVSIRTNGKSDAALVYGAGKTGSDETTMTMLGLLPLLARPDARRAANIGFGSGLTTRTLLQSKTLLHIDNIEIEPMMTLGARHLGDKVTPVFADSRNHFIFDDAKSVFARAAEPYQIIVSEPSNPWISGIGGLFTREFYRRVKTALAADGVFIQWLPFYESSPLIFASVFGALDESFADFRVYLSNDADAIIIAVANGTVPPLQNSIFADAAAGSFLNPYGYHSTADIEALFIGDKQHLMPYFRSFQAPVNSDYFPFVEHEAPLAFFRKTFYTWPSVHLIPVPFMEMAGARRPPPAAVTALPHSSLATNIARVQKLFAGLDAAGSPLHQRLITVRQAACADQTIHEESYMLALSDLITSLMPHATAVQMNRAWKILVEEPCITGLLAPENGKVTAAYTRFWHALSLRDGAALSLAADALLPFIDARAESGQIVMLAAIAAHYQQANYHRVLALLNQLPLHNPIINHAARFLGALASEKV